MNLFVHPMRNANVAAQSALIAACGLLTLAGVAAAQSAPVRLGEGSTPVQMAQQTQQRQPQRAPAQQGPRISEVAGRYAVLREDDKDTLCMVTLSEAARGKGYHRAQLAPACRDHGVVIFDPIAWTIDRQGHISLQARKGHKMGMERDANGVWRRIGDPKVRPLSLKRI
ncbi:MAG: AprI/Inh family metalloprotease inhibitor [Beijerinckiaceae bacterium]|nr:AprI/Inh family metalloprotease inhibitor [Beijerinckiaceae bacterium]